MTEDAEKQTEGQENPDESTTMHSPKESRAGEPMQSQPRESSTDDQVRFQLVLTLRLGDMGI